MKLFLSFLLLLMTGAAISQDKPEGLFINSKAPDFKAKDQSGADVVLKDIRKKGPVVVLFYRGHWCPYCSKELTRFQDSLSLISEKGAQLIAITPEAPDGISKTIEKTKAVFPILYDQDAKIAKAYQVSYVVDERTLNRYKNFGTDLLAINQQKTKANLPVPAIYIVNKEGSVTYRYFNDDYKKRPWVSEILEELKQVSKR
ncbi:MAG TPA: peroxiredoxin family protein [Chitinophagaceae bacterium]|jgi:peroxiredoxin|nr:peroxiredoxin family protein [Chitinophagaceae bacterium]